MATSAHHPRRHPPGDVLVQAVQNGDIEALDAIGRRFGARLLAVARRICQDEAEAEDALQDAFLSAGANLHEFRGEGSLEGWLGRIVQNAALRLRRGRKNDPAIHFTGVDLPSHAEDPEQAYHRSEMAEVIDKALLSLTPMSRVIFVLAEGGDWTGPEISERTGLTRGAVRTRLTRARDRLRGDLRDDTGMTVGRPSTPPAIDDHVPPGGRASAEAGPMA